MIKEIRIEGGNMEDFLYALRSFDGFWYYVTALVCVILIMAIIGFLMERSELQKQEVDLPKEEKGTKDETASTTPTPMVQDTTPTGPTVMDFSAVSTAPTTPVVEELFANPSPTSSVAATPVTPVAPVTQTLTPTPTPTVSPEATPVTTPTSPVIPELVPGGAPQEEPKKANEPFVLELNSKDL